LSVGENVGSGVGNVGLFEGEGEGIVLGIGLGLGVGNTDGL